MVDQIKTENHHRGEYLCQWVVTRVHELEYTKATKTPGYLLDGDSHLYYLYSISAPFCEWTRDIRQSKRVLFF